MPMNSNGENRIRLVYVITHPMSARHLLNGQLAYMKKQGFDVILITSPGEELNGLAEREGVSIHVIPMEREIRLLKDSVSLVRLYSLIRKLKPAIVNASTPKAGLLGMLASWLALVPVRIYLLRGLRLETSRGLPHFILRCTEKIASGCANRVLAVSESLRKKYVAMGLVDAKKILVLGAGSSNGIDLKRFESNGMPSREELLNRLKIPLDSIVIGFIGRLTRDKGIADLIDVLEILVPRFPNLYLLVVGDYEKGDPVPQHVAEKIETHPQIRREKFNENPVSYYRVMDIFTFPSHREGFPNAPLEAAAFGLPTVGFQVTGTVDSVQDGATGTLVPRKKEALADAIAAYIVDAELRRSHGTAARKRVEDFFQREQVWSALSQEYETLLQSGGRA